MKIKNLHHFNPFIWLAKIRGRAAGRKLIGAYKNPYIPDLRGNGIPGVITHGENATTDFLMPCGWWIKGAENRKASAWHLGYGQAVWKRLQKGPKP